MSRLAKKPVNIPSGVTMKQDSDKLVFHGPLGELKLEILPKIAVKEEEGGVRVDCNERDRQGLANWGTMWSLIRNAVQGVSRGFVRVLEIEGIGYRAALEGKELLLYLGYVNPVRFVIPDGVTIKIDKGTIAVSGINKDLVGRIAAQIRALKKPEPYKGKGIRYQGEVIRKKVGKKAAAVGGTGA